MDRSTVVKILEEVRQANLVKVEDEHTPKGLAQMNYNIGVNNMYFSAIFKITTYKEGEHNV